MTLPTEGSNLNCMTLSAVVSWWWYIFGAVKDPQRNGTLIVALVDRDSFLPLEFDKPGTPGEKAAIRNYEMITDLEIQPDNYCELPYLKKLCDAVVRGGVDEITFRQLNGWTGLLKYLSEKIDDPVAERMVRRFDHAFFDIIPNDIHPAAARPVLSTIRTFKYKNNNPQREFVFWNGKRMKWRRCQAVSCTRCASKGYFYCITHGGGHRCTYQGCTSAAASGGTELLCKAHGGGRRCTFQGCTKSAASGGTELLCVAHGGGRRCTYQGCTTAGASGGTELLCKAHGGGQPSRKKVRHGGN